MHQNLVLGYINAPDDQRQRFVRNPYRQDAGDWLYYTGDRGRYRPDGMLEILGRLDEQVKIRGIRIEPSEVTATLAQPPAVHACVVVPQKDASGQPVLVAYVVAPQLSAVTPGMLRAYLSHHLPAAMIPARFVLLEQFPLTPNGKVDRQALPMPDWTVPEWEGAFVAPRTPMEEILAATWAEVLKREQVGVFENFFALGGHSLLATQLMARVCEAFQVELPLRRFFEDPTIAGLAVAVTQWQTEQLASEAAAPRFLPLPSHRPSRSRRPLIP